MRYRHIQPHSLTIETPMGSLSATIMDGSHIRLEGTLVVNRRPHKAEMHLFRQGDRTFRLSSPLYLRRETLILCREDYRPTSKSAHTAVAEMIEPLVTEWAWAHVDLFLLAADAARDEIICQMSRRIESLEEAIATLKNASVKE